MTDPENYERDLHNESRAGEPGYDRDRPTRREAEQDARLSGGLGDREEFEAWLAELEAERLGDRDREEGPQ